MHRDARGQQRGVRVQQPDVVGVAVAQIAVPALSHETGLGDHTQAEVPYGAPHFDRDDGAVFDPVPRYRADGSQYGQGQHQALPRHRVDGHRSACGTARSTDTGDELVVGPWVVVGGQEFAGPGVQRGSVPVQVLRSRAEDGDLLGKRPGVDRLGQDAYGGRGELRGGVRNRGDAVRGQQPPDGGQVRMSWSWAQALTQPGVEPPQSPVRDALVVTFDTVRQVLVGRVQTCQGARRAVEHPQGAAAVLDTKRHMRLAGVEIGAGERSGHGFVVAGGADPSVLAGACLPELLGQFVACTC